MKTINGDITEVSYGFVCHQVNCHGVMGAGVALSIRKKWPATYTIYRQAYSEGRLELGNTIFAPATINVWVAHLCGQDKYGNGGVCTNYPALEKAIISVKEKATVSIKEPKEKAASIKIPVFFPKFIGCGLAGGDWEIVEGIIEKHIPDATIVNYSGK